MDLHCKGELDSTSIGCSTCGFVQESAKKISLKPKRSLARGFDLINGMGQTDSTKSLIEEEEGYRLLHKFGEGWVVILLKSVRRVHGGKMERRHED